MGFSEFSKYIESQIKLGITFSIVVILRLLKGNPIILHSNLSLIG